MHSWPRYLPASKARNETFERGFMDKLNLALSSLRREELKATFWQAFASYEEDGVQEFNRKQVERNQNVPIITTTWHPAVCLYQGAVSLSQELGQTREGHVVSDIMEQLEALFERTLDVEPLWRFTTMQLLQHKFWSYFPQARGVIDEHLQQL